jgi:hypothetical protein
MDARKDAKAKARVATILALGEERRRQENEAASTDGCVAVTIQQHLIPISSIVREDAFMMRVTLDQETVTKYAAAMAAGAVFPPIEVMEVGEQKFLTGGFHRTAAAELNGATEIVAQIRSGTVEQAILAAARAGAYEGLARTNEDKRKAVETLLATEWGRTSSDHMVAEAAGVSQPFVTKLRSTDNRYQSPSTRRGKDNKNRPSTRRQTGSAVSPTPPAQAIEEEQLDRVCTAADFVPPDGAPIADEPVSAIPNPESITHGVQNATESPRPALTGVNTDAAPSVSTQDPPRHRVDRPHEASFSQRTTGLDLATVWHAAPPLERARFVKNVGLKSLMAAVPEEWEPSIETYFAERRRPVAPPSPVIETAPDGFSEMPDSLRRASGIPKPRDLPSDEFHRSGDDAGNRSACVRKHLGNSNGVLKEISNAPKPR